MFNKLNRFKKKTKIIYLDWFAPLSIPFPQILPHIDLYIKKQFMKELNHYYSDKWIAETNLVDYYYKNHDIPFEKEHLKIKKNHIEKLSLGWNFATKKKYFDEIKKNNLNISKNKKIDIYCRIANKGSEWYEFHRNLFLKELKKIDKKYNLLISNRLINFDEYNNELKDSKICISPFGYGEVCWRDFEAILNSCLLIKPDMNHLITEPNIYVPFKTYIPVKWDLSDLKEKCEYYLSHEEIRNEIINNSQKVLKNYFKNKEFIKKIEEILIKLKLR